MKIANFVLLIAVLANISALKAQDYSNLRYVPCNHKDSEQLDREAGNSKLFIELAETSKQLCSFSLQREVMVYVPLRDVNLHGANLRLSNFSSSDAENVKLLRSYLEETSFKRANLKSANFNEAKLNNADLSEANLVGALFLMANLDGANLSKAVFGCSDDKPSKCTDITQASFYGPSCSYNHQKKDVVCNDEKLVFTNLKGAKNIKSLVYDYSDHLNFPSTLISLRKYLRESGFESEAREITYVIQKGLDEEDLFDLSKVSTLEILGAYARKFAFDYTVQYGASPSNALVIMLYTLIIFSFVYFSTLVVQVFYKLKFVGDVFLISPKITIPDILDVQEYEDGIFKIQSLLRVIHKYRDMQPPYGPDRQLELKYYFYICRHAVWFSILSSFHFGWRDLNVGSWLARLQPTLFTYKPTKMFRILSGIQSLVCIYLLAIFVISYFGNPWG